ncbi:MAG TPA: hypothetical protein VH592_08825 [Gemmataceae bacterium]
MPARLLLFEQAGEAFDLSFKFGDAALECLAAGASGFVHTDKIAKCPARSCGAGTITSPRRPTR